MGDELESERMCVGKRERERMNESVEERERERERVSMCVHNEPFFKFQVFKVIDLTPAISIIKVSPKSH